MRSNFVVFLSTIFLIAAVLGGQAWIGYQLKLEMLSTKENVLKNQELVSELNRRTRANEDVMARRRKEIDLIEKELGEINWSAKQHFDWADELKRLNPSLKMPEQKR